MKCPICSHKMKGFKKDYHYTESGLDNVILKGVTVYSCKKCGEEIPEIPGIECLHRVIADMVIVKRTPLTGPEIRFLRKEMRYKANMFASILRVHKVTLSKWENDVEKPDKAYDVVVRLFYLRFKEEQSRSVLPGIRLEDLLREISPVQQKVSFVIPPEKWEECLNTH